MNDPVAILKRDHREVAEMLKTLDSSKPGVRRRQTVDKLTQAPRAAHGDRGALTSTRSCSGSSARKRPKEAGVEHRLAREGLAELRRLVDEPGFGAAAAMPTAGIRHHVKERSKRSSPSSSARSTATNCAELGDRVAAAKKPAAPDARRGLTTMSAADTGCPRRRGDLP